MNQALNLVAKSDHFPGPVMRTVTCFHHYHRRRLRGHKRWEG